MAMNYITLSNEINSDPLARGYAGMSDQEVADDLNTTYRTKNKTTVLGSEVLNATDDAEFTALSDVNKDRWLALCAVEQINVTSGVAKSLEASIFGPGTTTRTNLLTLRTESISRATELELETVLSGDVQYARTL